MSSVVGHTYKFTISNYIVNLKTNSKSWYCARHAFSIFSSTENSDSSKRIES